MADDRLQQHCDMLNALDWVKGSGKLFFVNERRAPDGRRVFFVDRH